MQLGADQAGRGVLGVGARIPARTRQRAQQRTGLPVHARGHQGVGPVQPQRGPALLGEQYLGRVEAEHGPRDVALGDGQAAEVLQGQPPQVVQGVLLGERQRPRQVLGRLREPPGVHQREPAVAQQPGQQPGVGIGPHPVHRGVEVGERGLEPAELAGRHPAVDQCERLRGAFGADRVVQQRAERPAASPAGQQPQP
ncbi:hypothetical protein GCM10022205_38640 [Spinactinospora alkalitolerans]